MDSGSKKKRSAFQILRILITTHDAMNYFARAYGFQVKSLQVFLAGVWIEGCYGAGGFHLRKRVPAIFVENILSDQSLKAVAEGCRSAAGMCRLGRHYTQMLWARRAGLKCTLE